MRWKALFFLNPNLEKTDQETYGFNTLRSPPVISELKEFEDSMVNLIQSIEFEDKTNDFQRKLHKDLKTLNNDSKLTVKADKTTNYYKMEREKYNDLVDSNVTKTYKKADKKEVLSINRDAKRIAEKIHLGDRIEKLAEKKAFITLKDHKDNFHNKPACRLISPTKSEIGHVSKTILSRLVKSVVKSTEINLWKSTREVLEWYRKFPSKQEGNFINFDIVEFYPSITEKLLLKAIEFAKQYDVVQDHEKDIIIHAKRTIVFNGEDPWKKKDSNNGLFDVTMGSFDGAESCELVVCYMLSLLQPKYGKSIGLYRDDGLGIFKETPKEIDRIKKDICKTFQENDLRITIEANKKIINFLDVTLDLNSGQHMPYMKPNNVPRYVNTKSNHPPAVLNNIPEGINTRLSELSSSEEVFNRAAPIYQKALDNSGYTYKLHYVQKPKARKRSRKRNVVWYNPPYNQNVKTNVGKAFLKIVDKCFPPGNKLHKIFNRNTIKLSYSCMPNVKVIIEGNNKRKLRNDNQTKNEKKCSCPRNTTCPLKGECLTKDLIYQATVTCDDKRETYVGLTATDFKTRYRNHKASFKAETKRNSTELSKHIWQLKDRKLNYEITWKLLYRAPHYTNVTKRCNLCIAEKYFIICKPESATLNKRNELISKCRHKDKFLLKNVT